MVRPIAQHSFSACVRHACLDMTMGRSGLFAMPIQDSPSVPACPAPKQLFGSIGCEATAKNARGSGPIADSTTALLNRLSAFTALAQTQRSPLYTYLSALFTSSLPITLGKPVKGRRSVTALATET
ncbi:uncharacterized protein [Dermacentor albipictus]|uniref:uncharacterized protein isoform X1 n=1 Tax=Dermacentor albipictus TaxID=60249 RepID=UPI0038FC58C3